MAPVHLGAPALEAAASTARAHRLSSPPPQAAPVPGLRAHAARLTLRCPARHRRRERLGRLGYTLVMALAQEPFCCKHNCEEDMSMSCAGVVPPAESFYEHTPGFTQGLTVSSACFGPSSV